MHVQDLAAQLAEITAFPAVSLQPNSGASGEYAGLMSIRAYHQSRNEGHRNVCIIPTSAHGTNPASAIMAGMKIVTVGADRLGNVDMTQLREKAEANKDKCEPPGSLHGPLVSCISMLLAAASSLGRRDAVYCIGMHASAPMQGLNGICCLCAGWQPS